jgi:ribonucleoside-diphosphate reductase alpha chain
MNVNLTMKIRKRNGELVDVSFDKITRRIKQECDEANLIIDPILIAQKICARLYHGMKTSDIDEFTARTAVSRVTVHPDYGTLATRITVSNMHKNAKVNGLYKFSDKVVRMYNYRDKKNNSIRLLSDKYYQVVMDNKDFFDQLIDYRKDHKYDYFGLKTLEKSYFFKCGGESIETPQDLILRVAIGLHFDDLDAVKESYKLMSDKKFTHASPTLFNAGSDYPQLLSCFLLGVDDSLESIYKSYYDCAMISKRAGGIGVHVSSLRANNSLIKGTNGESNGIIPVARQYNMTAEHVNQGGRRQGSIALYMEPHHADIMEFLKLKLNDAGNERARARDLFYAMWMSDLFMERVEADTEWSLFSPDECEKLNDVFGEEYRELYMRYENMGMARSTLPARDIWKAILKSQIETGTPYICYKDAANIKSNQKHYGTIKSSNLCAEIMEFSSSSEYACCTLASACLSEFVKERLDSSVELKSDSNKIKIEFDFDELEVVTRVMVRNLNKIIDINKYPVPETKLSNDLHRPLGIGVQGLGDAFIRMRMAFDSKEAAELNKQIFETMYYAAISESCKIASDPSIGPYPTFKGSPMSEGKFQFDLWKVSPSTRYDWETLRANVIKHGVRNSLLIALMPTASTSQICGNAECFQPYTSNVFKRQTLAGTFVVVNKYLVQDMMSRGLWNEKIKDKLIANGGSVQNIPEVPDDLKPIYKTIWEIKNRVYIDMAADRAPYICQSQSLNLWIERPTVSLLTSMHMHAWKRGLKTGMYYLRSTGPVEAQQFTIDPEEQKQMDTPQKPQIVCTDEVCVMCEG